MPSHSSVSAIAVAVIPATVSPVLPLLGGNVTSCPFDLPGWSRVCACGEDRGKDQRGGSQPAQQAAAFQRMALVIHHRVSNNSGALFFTLLIARPSGRSSSTSLAGRIRAAASSGAACSQASMSSNSLYRISWVLLVAQGQSEGVGWNADSACRRFTVRLLYSQMVAWTLRSVKEVLSGYMVAKQGIVLQYRRA